VSEKAAMNISVRGFRTGLADWEAVRGVPAEQLPPLSPEQREVARKLHISEEDYARSALAGQLTMDELIAKTERFAKYLLDRVKEMAPQVSIESVLLDTLEHKFVVSLKSEGRITPVHIAEEVVDDYFDSGSAEMGRRLNRILNLAFHARVA
jgi:hypothetical protein